MSDELRECPFCGSTPKYLYNPAHDVHCIWCANKMCGVRPDVDSYVSKEQAVENWNTRPIEDALRAEVLRLNAQYYEMETYGCPDCNGDGEIKGNTCFTCNGHGVLYVKPNEAAE